MSDLAEADRDPRLSFQPGRLWSLLSMLRTFASAFVRMSQTLADFRQMDTRNETRQAAERRVSLTVGDRQLPVRELARAHIGILSKWTENLPLKSTMAQVKRIEEAVERSCTNNELFDALADLGRRFHDDLEGEQFYYVRSELIRFYEGEALFGEQVEAAFPNAIEDISEAGKCLALGRHTAAVFHLMRCLEPPLNSLGKALSIDVASNWNKALNEIEKEIRGRSVATHGASWKDDEPFYAEAATHFRMLKNAWRNHTMHLRHTYSEERAREIFDSVRAFMRHLSGRLSEYALSDDDLLLLGIGVEEASEGSRD
jgi:hypothetical protein